MNQEKFEEIKKTFLKPFVRGFVVGWDKTRIRILLKKVLLQGKQQFFKIVHFKQCNTSRSLLIDIIKFGIVNTIKLITCFTLSC